LTKFVHELRDGMVASGFSESAVHYLIGSGNSGWRMLMMVGAVPAVLTFFIRIFVPESQRWEKERAKGAASHWATRDLLAVLVGSLGACGIVAVWSPIWQGLLETDGLPVAVSVVATLVGLVIVTLGYIYPLQAYLRRAEAISAHSNERGRPVIGVMLLAACLSGVALLGTWGTIQQAPTWADQLAKTDWPEARSYTQIWAAVGAIVGTILAALLADFLGRRITYTLLCLSSLIIVPTLFLGTVPLDWHFLPVVFLAGAITASFYGWLPLYLPELFRTSIRATGQGFGFNFGRIIAAVGVLQLGNLKDLFTPLGWGDPQVYTMLSAIYVVGMILIWFVPETKGQPLPD
jgi:SHS family sialic acid transporter-like MFS transporter